MSFEQRDNSGALFKNKKKTKDTHPDATGTAMIGGVMYYVSAWTKDGGKGRFQTLSFKPIEEQQPAAQKHASPDYSDDIPF